MNTSALTPWLNFSSQRSVTTFHKSSSLRMQLRKIPKTVIIIILIIITIVLHQQFDVNCHVNAHYFIWIMKQQLQVAVVCMTIHLFQLLWIYNHRYYPNNNHPALLSNNNIKSKSNNNSHYYHHPNNNQ